MRKLLFMLLVLPLAALGQSANDLVITQRKSDGSGNIQRNVTAGASALLGFSSSTIPVKVTIGSGLSFDTGTNTLSSTGGAGISDGDKGDITVSASGATWTIDNGVVSLAKMADMATTSLIGRSTAGTGVPEVLSASSVRALLDLEPGTDFLAYPTGTPTGSKFLRDDNSWQTISGGGDALTSNPLSQFAATTSAQLAGVISDETGSGLLVFGTSPTLTTPNLGTPSAATLTNATGLPIATGVSGLGTGVATALAVNVGSSGAFVANGGALGTPSSGTLTNATGLPIASGVSGLGTGVATALGVNTGSAGAVVLFNGALGTPSSGTLTNATGLPISTGVSGLGTGVATALATPSSANLASAVTDETGTGALVFASSPTLVTPTLGVASATSLSTTRQAHGNAGATETFDRANGDTHTATLDANLTVTLSGWSSSGTLSSMLIGLTQDGTGGWTVTWPAAVVTAPTVTTTAGAITWVNLWTTDGGTTIYASGTADGVPISSVSGLGTGVATALAVNVGSAGAPVVNGGALGTPSSGTLTNATGLPVSTGVSGLGTGVATALAVNVGSLGAFVTNGGALGTPSSGTLTNATGLPIASGVSGLGTGVATALATPSSANIASAVTDETGSGLLVFATSPALTTPNLGTPSAATLTNATGLPVSTGISGLGTGVATALAVNAGSSGAFLRTADRTVTFVLTIDDLADSLNYDIGFVGAAFTVTEIRGVHFGTGLSSPSVVATIKHGTDRTSGTTVEAVTVTSSTTGTSVTSGIDDATIPANSFIWIETASKSGTTDNMTIIVRGTYD